MRLFFAGLALGASLVRLAGACWFESASSSRRLFNSHALFSLHCFGRSGSGFVCLAFLSH